MAEDSKGEEREYWHKSFRKGNGCQIFIMVLLLHFKIHSDREQKVALQQ